MPIPGPLLSQQIHQARRETQAALREARAAAASTALELSALAAEARETLRTLVPEALRGAACDAILAAADETDETIQEILLRREQHVSRLDRELAHFDLQRAAAEQQLEQITATLDDYRSRQQELSDRLAQRLAEDERFQRCSAEAAETEAALERAEASLAEIEYDAMQKLPAYEKSRLFKYLYDRRLGTSRYVAGSIDRRVDNWIAGLIDYPQAKAGYDFLKNTAEQVREWMAAERDKLAPLMNQLELRRDEQAADLGLLRLGDELRAAEQKREAVLGQLEQIRRKKDAARRELAEIEEAGARYYLPAFEKIESMLEQTEQQVLEVADAPVSAPRVSRIIARLRALASQRQTVQLQAMSREHRIASLNEHLSELGYFHQRFYSAGFDSSRSHFHESLDLVGELARVREGDDSIDFVWQRMRRRQQFAPSARDAAPNGPLQNGLRDENVPPGDAPLARVLVSAMAQAASPTMSCYARRAATRWTHSHRGNRSAVG